MKIAINLFRVLSFRVNFTEPTVRNKETVGRNVATHDMDL